MEHVPSLASFGDSLKSRSLVCFAGKPGLISMALRKRLQQYMLTGPRALLTPVPWNAPAASCCLKDHPPICSNTPSVRALDNPEVDFTMIRQKIPEQMLQGSLDRITSRPILGVHVGRSR